MGIIMITKKRIISAVLLASMMLSLAACGKDGDSTGDTTGTESTAAPTGNILPAGIEAQNYEGKVNILMPKWSLYTTCFDPGEDMTDILNKALYNREVKVEEYLGVEITYEYVPTIKDYFAPIAAAVATNDDLYQILLSHCIKNNADMITGGCLTDMNNLDIDFTGEWFNSRANEALEVDGKQFFCISDYMIPDPNVIVFNNGIIEKNQLENPYELVREGKWTIDKMTEMASKVTADNGDSVWDNRDTYGFATPDDWFLSSFIHAADVDIIGRNGDGDFEIVFGDERAYSLMEKLDTLFNGPDTYTFHYLGLNKDAPEASEALPIENERSLFSILSFSNFWSIRDVDTEIGILPFPKLDESQEEYYSLDWSGLMSVPFSVSEDSYEMVGDVIELLAYYSEEEVIPTYIEDTLGKKFARDENWSEMLGIIFDGIVFDPTLSYFGFASGTSKYLYSPDFVLVEGGENTFASFLATNETAAKNAVAEFNDAVKEIDG